MTISTELLTRLCVRKYGEEMHSMAIRNITFIGLGTIGTPMVTFLLKAGYNVVGFDIVKKKKVLPYGRPLKAVGLFLRVPSDGE